MSTNNAQQQMIQDAMKSIAERKPGRSKLVYDKTRRTIVAVAEGSHTPAALNITADDADMFAVATLSSRWLRDHWTEIAEKSFAAVRFSCWDAGDALTQIELGVQPSVASIDGAIVFSGSSHPAGNTDLLIELTPSSDGNATEAIFSAPDGIAYHANA